MSKQDRPRRHHPHLLRSYDPVKFPRPTAPPPDLVSPAFEHLLIYGNTRRLTEEELARAVRIDPSQIAGLGPSLEAIAEMLRERKRKILATYETDSGPERGRQALPRRGREGAAAEEARRALPARPSRRSNSTTWRTSGTPPATTATRSPASLVQLVERLGEKYQVDELAGEVRVHRPRSR